MSERRNSLSVGFIGIGAMGGPMAACLRKHGFSVSVFDARAGVAEAFAAEHGATAATSLGALASCADVVITMLPTSQDVAQVLEAGVLTALAPGAVVVEMSSGVPAETQRLAELVAKAGGTLVDAPVSGGVARAVTGELAIMTGGDATALARVRPALEAMGTTIMHCGGIGAGQAMKALNNLVSAGGYLIGIEALLIGQRFGLDPGTMVDVLNVSSGMNNSTKGKFRQQVLSRRFASGFGLDLMVKDLTIALGLSRDTATPAPFAALCREMWASSQRVLGPGQDHTALARLCEMLAGSELGESG
jgi:3-hydroxyisobutyrate dehydrogenase